MVVMSIEDWIKKTFLSELCLTFSTKHFNHSVNSSAFFQPESDTVTMLPYGAPSFNSNGTRLLLKIIIGGTCCAPEAFTQQTTVVLTPLSALDVEPIFFSFHTNNF